MSENAAIKAPAVPAEPQSAAMPPRMDTSDWMLLAVSAAACFLYVFAHTAFGAYLPGIGLTITHWALLAALLTCLRSKGRLRVRRNGRGWFLLTLAVLLGGCYGIFSDNTLRWMNLPVLALLTVQAVYALTGREDRDPLSVSAFSLLSAGSSPACSGTGPFLSGRWLSGRSAGKALPLKW